MQAAAAQSQKEHVRNYTTGLRRLKTINVHMSKGVLGYRVTVSKRNDIDTKELALEENDPAGGLIRTYSGPGCYAVIHPTRGRYHPVEEFYDVCIFFSTNDDGRHRQEVCENYFRTNFPDAKRLK